MKRRKRDGVKMKGTKIGIKLLQMVQRFKQTSLKEVKKLRDDRGELSGRSKEEKRRGAERGKRK